MKRFMLQFSLLLLFLSSFLFILPSQISADCGWVESNPTCVSGGSVHNYQICYEECEQFCSSWPVECNGEDATLGCASLYGIGSPNECVCDDYSQACTDSADDPNPYNGCPKVSLNPVCFNPSGGAILGDIPPYIDCGIISPGTTECCLDTDECTAPTGECDIYNDATCHIDNDGPCNPCVVPSEYPNCTSGTLDNFVPRCHINEEDNTTYCTCTTDEFFDDPHDEICWVNGRQGINSAIGCIPVASTQGFVNFLLGWGVGIAGGIAFILIVVAGIMIVTSAGDPKRVQAGKELLTAAVSGLLLLIFGAFVLEFIGVDILNIPGFGQ